MGITPKVKKYLHKRLRCRPEPFDLKRYAGIQDYLSGINSGIDKHARKREQMIGSMHMADLLEVTKN